MKLSTRTRYGMRAMLELALNYKKGPLQTKIIARNQDISVKYLEQLMAILKAGGLIQSIRGAKGGYVLAKNPSQIRLNAIFTCLEGPILTVECIEDKGYCDKVADCITRELWTRVQQAIINVLEAITLQDLINKAKKTATVNYQI